jgi:hypothetical protein
MEIMIKSEKKLSPAEVKRRGEEIYQKIKHQYLPQCRGKFLVIETKSGKVYLDDTTGRALDKAYANHPDDISSFYSVRIGYKYLFFTPWLMEEDEMID